MSVINGRVVTLADRITCIAYRGRRGDIVNAEDNSFTGIVNDPAAAPFELDQTPFEPGNDNLTDLGSLTARFRNLFLGTGIQNPGVGLTTLAITNPTAGQVCDLTVDGGISAGNGFLAGTDAALTQPVAGSAFLSANGGEGLHVTSPALAVNGLTLTTAISGGAVSLQASGTDAAIALDIMPFGADAVTLRGGAGAARVNVNDFGLSFFNAAPIAQAGAIGPLTLTVAGDMPGPTPAEITARLNLIENSYNAFLVTQRTTTGYGFLAG